MVRELERIPSIGPPAGWDFLDLRQIEIKKDGFADEQIVAAGGLWHRGAGVVLLQYRNDLFFRAAFALHLGTSSRAKKIGGNPTSRGTRTMGYRRSQAKRKAQWKSAEWPPKLT